MSARNNLLSKIAEARTKSESEKKFSGTLMDYVELVEKDPSLVKTAHQRLNEALTEHGSYVMPDSDPRKHKIFDGENLKIHKYFEGEFFGMEKVIAKVMSFLDSAAHRGEESRQVLLFMGPVGAGKSALTEHIKRALEGKKYYHLKGDPHRGEPLQLIPRSLRGDFEKALSVKIEGDISPVARHKLLNDLSGKYENFEVEETSFSQRARRGVGVVPPMDANSQDVSVLIGSVDISKLDKFAEDDPRALSLNGAFNVGNRGIV